MCVYTSQSPTLLKHWLVTYFPPILYYFSKHSTDFITSLVSNHPLATLGRKVVTYLQSNSFPLVYSSCDKWMIYTRWIECKLIPSYICVLQHRYYNCVPIYDQRTEHLARLSLHINRKVLSKVVLQCTPGKSKSGFTFV